jgi:hypothetical protein
MMQKRRGTRQQLLAILHENGFPLGKSTLDKLCAPAIGAGPPVFAWWGKRPIYDFNEGLAWAENRLRPTRARKIDSTTA